MGSGYSTLQLSKEQAHKVCSDAAAALLRLAVAVVPQEQQSFLASTSAWMQKEQERFAKAGGVDSHAEYMASTLGCGVEQILEGEEEMGEDAEALRQLLFPNGSSSGASSSSSRKGPRGGKQRSQQQAAAPTPNISLDAASIDSKEARMRQLAATGYLCWPHARLCSNLQDVGSSGTTCSSTSSSSSAGSSATSAASSSSCSSRSTGASATTIATTGSSSSATHVGTYGAAGAGNACAFDSTAMRLQALAAAAVAKWRWCAQKSPQKLTMESVTQSMKRFHQFMHIMLLLIQELQGAPPELRAAFLHSPAATMLLYHLQDMSLGDAALNYVIETLVQETPQEGAAAAAAGGQRVRRAAGDWLNCVPNGHALVEILLLPGLLLAPDATPAAGAAPPAPTSSPGVVMFFNGE
jgi:hypothetical protein